MGGWKKKVGRKGEKKGVKEDEPMEGKEDEMKEELNHFNPGR